MNTYAQGITSFNRGWEFALVDDFYSEPNWQPVTIPHDWSIAFDYQESADGATGYLKGGVGRYRKSFVIDNYTRDKRVFIVFDAIYSHAQIIINGHQLDVSPNGYVPIRLDVSRFVEFDNQANVIEVYVDRTRDVDSRWYSGSGIYRDIEIEVKPTAFIESNSVWLTTDSLTEKFAKVTARGEVCNSGAHTEVLDVVHQLSFEGQVVATETQPLRLEAGQRHELNQELMVAVPKLWGIGQGHLYQLTLTLFDQQQAVIDDVTINCGIRQFEFDKDNGFFLNGENHKIKGVCLHHDTGLFGAAATQRVWERRLAKLMSCGVNAVRSAHNPSSKALLNACDRLGILMQDELFDEWDYPKDKRLNKEDVHSDYRSRGSARHFYQWGQADAEQVVKSHRHHASIFMWSIGNEIEWTYPRNKDATGFFDAQATGNYFWELPPHSPEQIAERLEALPRQRFDIGETANKIATWVKQLDTSRVITANCILPSSSYLSGYADALDVVGFSYRRVVYDFAHQHYAKWPIIGNENLPQWHEWKAVLERDFVSGIFLWTGIDYLGESAGAWPVKARACGLLDLAGFEKEQYHFFKTIWTDEPHTYIRTLPINGSPYQATNNGDIELKQADEWQTRLWDWHKANRHWNYRHGEEIAVEVFSNAERVELFHNQQSLGIKQLSKQDDHIYKWRVPFKAGELKAIGHHADGKASEYVIKTASDATSIKLYVDDTTQTFVANGQDIIHVRADVLDAAGQLCAHQDYIVDIKVEGVVEFIGADNGAVDNLTNHTSAQQSTRNGSLLVAMRTTQQAGDATLVCRASQDLESRIQIQIIGDTKQC